MNLDFATFVSTVGIHVASPDGNQWVPHPNVSVKELVCGHLHRSSSCLLRALLNSQVSSPHSPHAMLEAALFCGLYITLKACCVVIE